MAFPDWAILLDDFNRADGEAGPNWGVGVYSPASSLLVVDNQGGLAGGVADGCWTAEQMDSLVEVYCQLPVLPTSNGIIYLFGRVVEPGSGSQIGYCVSYNFVSGLLELYRMGGGSLTFLQGTAHAQAFGAGDWLGLRCQGSNITGYHRPAAGVWAQVVSAVDSTYPGPGYVGVTIFDGNNVGRIDNFSAGPSLSGIAPAPATAGAAGVLGSVTSPLDALTFEVSGTGAAPHKVLDLREGMRQPVVLFVWRDGGSDGLNFSAATVYFRMRARMAEAGVFKVNAECVKLGEGQVVWSPVAGDLDTPGEYYAYLVADYGGGVYRTSEMIVVRVWEGL